LRVAAYLSGGQDTHDALNRGGGNWRVREIASASYNRRLLQQNLPLAVIGQRIYLNYAYIKNRKEAPFEDFGACLRYRTGARKEYFGMSMFDRAETSISEWLSGVFDLAELVKGSTINLAVTGLSRAGKTVFITSLVHTICSVRCINLTACRS
jgi:YcjX-like family, DUF463